MQFDSSYFRDEVREGFFVTGMMKRCWAAQMEVLSDISALCDKYNITYMADSGTLLGTVRHGGFIPWDDDMDIVMLREDYEEFLRHAGELPDWYSVLNWRNRGDWFNAFSRVVDTEFIRFDEKFMEKFHGFPYAAGVDIFVLDYMYPDAEREAERRERANILADAAAATAGLREIDDEAEEFLSNLEGMYDIRIDREKNVSHQLFARLEEVISEVKREDAEDVCFMSAWLKFNSSNCRKEAYDKVMHLPFENMEIPVPVCYDEVLRSRYGDYMTMNKGGGMHDYPYYAAQEEILRDKVGWRSWKYGWDPEEITLAERTRAQYRNAKAEVENKITQLESLIQSAPELYESLRPQVETLKQSFHVSSDRREEVVFLTVGGMRWDHFRYFWKEEKQKENVDVFVIPIPWFDTDFLGKVIDEHYVDSGYPEDVVLTSFNDYNLEARHPKRIYFQIPYDGENPSMTVHPVFYSDALLKYTYELIYVPYLDIKRIDSGDDKSYFSLNYYAKMPGVMHADRIILPSENLRKQYISALVDFGGEETKSHWESVIRVADYMPEPEINEGPKKLYFYTDGAPMAIYGKKALKKLRGNLELFSKSTERIRLYWQIYGRMEEMLKEKDEALFTEFFEIKSAYEKEPWIQMVPVDDRKTIHMVDAFYGDPGLMAHLANVRGIPVLIRDMECE
ncbi:MAG: LicD family protein [Lachnospiraceae bacterium]|nr:LicD family protein [Lachnospiraceae bacterium]